MSKQQKYNYLLLSGTLIFLLSACQQERSKGFRFTSYRKNLFNPLYVDQIISPPITSGSIWNMENLKQLGVKRISVALKKGSNANEDLEKHQYVFDSLGRPKNYQYFDYESSKDVVHQAGFEYQNTGLSRIQIYKHQGMGNIPPVEVISKSRFTAFITSRGNGKNDTLFYYPNVNTPELIIEKIANKVHRLEVVVEKGNGPMHILKQVSRVDTNLTQYDLSEKIITYTQKGLPQESFYMDENWNSMDLLRKWEYNSDNQPVTYMEWLHGTVVKDIAISYNEHALPKKVIFNRKKYILIYRKNE